jgi:hypothetical protein
MMATKDDDSKSLEGEPPASVAQPVDRKRVPRFETASEIRGYPLGPNGTALGVGGPTPGVSEEPGYYDEELSAEETERIDALLTKAEKDLRRRPRAHRFAPEEIPTRPTTPATPAPGQMSEIGSITVPSGRIQRRERARAWIVGGATVLVLGVAVVFLASEPGRSPPSTAYQFLSPQSPTLQTSLATAAPAEAGVRFPEPPASDGISSAPPKARTPKRTGPPLSATSAQSSSPRPATHPASDIVTDTF